MTTIEKLLVFSPVATHPPHRGNRQRILQMAEVFRQAGFNVELVVGRNRAITPEAKEFWAEIHVLHSIPGWKPSRKNVPFDKWYTPGLGEEIAHVVERTGAQALLFCYIFHSRALEFLPPSVTTVLDAHDVFSQRHELYPKRSLSPGFFSCTAEDEARYLRRADIVTAISDSDAQSFTSMVTTPNVLSLPYVSPMTENEKQRPPRRAFTRHFGAVLSANDLNLTSLNSFVDSVSRRFGTKPPFSISIAGDIHRFAKLFYPARYALRKPGWLQFTGQLADIGSFYDSVDGVIVPVGTGSGMAVKFAEAIHRGLPTLSTAAGSRGHPVTSPFHRFAGQDELVRALASLTEDDMSDLAQASDALAQRMFDLFSERSNALISLVRDTMSLKRQLSSSG